MQGNHRRRDDLVGSMSVLGHMKMACRRWSKVCLWKKGSRETQAGLEARREAEGRGRAETREEDGCGCRVLVWQVRETQG